MRGDHRAPGNSKSGFVLISVAALLIGLTAFLGLAFDIGDLQWTRRRLQVAADSAANAATREILAGSSPSAIVSAAKADAALNGFTDGSAGVTVTINNPPKTGYDTTNSQAVEAIVAQNVHVYFLAIFGMTTTPVHARAVSKTAPSTDCVYILSPSGSKALSMSGSVNISLSCGVIVNSTDSAGISANGTVTFTGQAAVVGGYNSTGTVQWNPAPPQTGADTQNDPLSYVSPPAVGPCDFTKYKVSGNYNVTVNPGVYCNGMSFSGGGTITFNPGTYILLGGGLTISGSVVMNGTGVTFYNTQGSGYSYGPISISGAANSTLTAPTTGPFAGILFFQDRTIASPAASSFTGTSNDNFVGALYFPTSALTYSGASAGQYTILVSRTLTLNGGTTVDANYSSLPQGSPLRSTAVLSE